jgi:hypothetical protein
MQEIFLLPAWRCKAFCAHLTFYYQRFTVKSRVATRAEAGKSKGKDKLSRPRIRVAGGGKGTRREPRLAQLENLEGDVIRAATAFCQLD